MELTESQRARVKKAMEEYEFYQRVQVFKATNEDLMNVLAVREEIGIPYIGKPCSNCTPEIFRQLYLIYKK